MARTYVCIDGPLGGEQFELPPGPTVGGIVALPDTRKERVWEYREETNQAGTTRYWQQALPTYRYQVISNFQLAYAPDR